MDPAAAKFIGAGLAAIGMGAAAIGVGLIFGNFLSGALRNPTASDAQFGRAFIGAALSSSRFFCSSFFDATCDAPESSRAHRFRNHPPRRI